MAEKKERGKEGGKERKEERKNIDKDLMQSVRSQRTNTIGLVQSNWFQIVNFKSF